VKTQQHENKKNLESTLRGKSGEAIVKGLFSRAGLVKVSGGKHCSIRLQLVLSMGSFDGPTQAKRGQILALLVPGITSDDYEHQECTNIF
jgi:hypothetical protein